MRGLRSVGRGVVLIGSSKTVSAACPIYDGKPQ